MRFEMRSDVSFDIGYLVKLLSARNALMIKVHASRLMIKDLVCSPKLL